MSSRRMEWRGALERGMLAMFVAYLFLRSTASSFWWEGNRFYFHWQRSDAVAVFLAIGIVAALFYLAYLALRRCGHAGDILIDVAFAGITLFYLKINFVETLGQYVDVGTAVSLALKGVAVLIFAGLVFWRKRIVNALRGVCLILSPIVLMYLVVLITAPPIVAGGSLEATPLSDHASNSNGFSRICIFVFDEWSYDRVFENENVRKQFPHLARVAEKSVVFHGALSPAQMTSASIPSLLCGVQGADSVKNNRLWLTTATTSAVCDAYEHVFKRAKSMGYRTALYGNCLPYAAMFNTGVDRCESMDIYKIMGKGTLAVCVGFLLENANIRLSFLPWFRAAYNAAKKRYFARMAGWIHSQAMKEIEGSCPSFLFFHYPVPHAPFIFDRNGVIPDGKIEMKIMNGYEANLEYVDRLVGEIMATVERLPDAGRTAIVLTADHSCRFDSEMTEKHGEISLRHVPLVVHITGQAGRIDVRDEFHTRLLPNVLLRCGQFKDVSADDFVQLCGTVNKENGYDQYPGNSAGRLH